MGERRSRIALAACACAALLACRATPPEPPPPPWPPFEAADLGSAPNVHRVGTLWVSGMPSEDDLELAARRGLRLVVDVRPAYQVAAYDVAAVARANGLDHARFPFDPEAPDADVLDRVLAELRRPGAKLLFCEDGGGAASVLAVRRVVDEGVPLDEALTEARRLGMKPGPAEEFVRAAVARATGGAP